jgi:hypothetical protein
MDYESIYPVLIEWAQTLTSPDGQTEVDGIPFYRVGTAWDQADGVGEVQVTTERTMGQDFETHEYRSGPDDVLLTAEGPRQLVVQFRVTSIFQEAAETAQNRLGQIRLRGRRGSARALLRPVGLSVASFSDLVVVERYDSNGHTLSVATMDVTFNAYASDDAGAEAGDYIGTVVASSDLDGAPAGAEWDDEVLTNT